MHTWDAEHAAIHRNAHLMTLRTVLLSLLVFMPVAGVSAAGHADVKLEPSTAVRVTGAVTAPQTFDVAALQALVAHDTGPVDVICASGAIVGKVDSFRGVRLRDVIDAVGLKLDGDKDGRRMVILARGTDGYLATFSWNELYNTDVGPEVLVAWEKDGEALQSFEGQLLLISGKDIRTGPRRVRNLGEIEIQRVP